MAEQIPFDPVCLAHGKPKSTHWCVQCTFCFKDLQPKDCDIDEQGEMWDVCHECAEKEKTGWLPVPSEVQE